MRSSSKFGHHNLDTLAEGSRLVLQHDSRLQGLAEREADHFGVCE